MPKRLNDAEITRLLAERKTLPPNYERRLKLKPKRGHKERELEIAGESESSFRLILRQAEANPLDFSVILSYRVPRSNQLIRLRRYNGKSHEHTNKIERERFYDFHIHTATERYQDLGTKEDAHAKPTNRYASLREAIQCMFEDCGFEIPGSSHSQESMF